MFEGCGPEILKYGYKKIEQTLGLEFYNHATEFKGGVRGHGHQQMHGIIDLQTLESWSQKEGLGVILASETASRKLMQPKMLDLALA